MQTEDLIFYIQESEKALETINGNLTNKLTNLELQIVLAGKFGYSRRDSTKIVSHRLTAQEIVATIEEKDLVKPVEIAKIIFNTSILPEGVPSRIDEKQVKVNGEIWRIHKNDKDHCPSNPHGHNIENGYKLHLGSGELFNYKCDPLNKKIKRKDLISIRNQLSDFTLPTLINEKVK